MYNQLCSNIVPGSKFDNPTAQRELAIPTLLSKQDALLGELWSISSELENRLSKISQSEPQSPCPAEIKPVASPTSVMDRLETSNRAIRAVIDKHQDMLRLLEV